MSCAGCWMSGTVCAAKAQQPVTCPSKIIPIEKARRESLGGPSSQHKTPCIWALVVDSCTAHIFSKHEDDFSLIAEFTPPHREENVFAREIASWLDAEAGRKSFDRLVLIACPHMLNELRKTIGPSVYGRIAAEINRDIAKMGEADLRAELGKILWF